MPVKPLVSDNFTRPNVTPLAGPAWGAVTGANALAVVSNQCVAAATSGDQIYTGITFPADQYISVTVGNFSNAVHSTSEIDLFARSSTNLATSYFCGFISNGDGSTCNVAVNNSSGPIGSTTIGTIHTGDVLSLSCFGSTIVAHRNGVALVTVTDATIPSGGSVVIGVTNYLVQSDTSVSLFVGGTSGGGSTSSTIYPGTFYGSSLATAFSNPYNLDLLQVVNEGGQVVWSLSALGVATTNPVSPTPGALLNRFFGSSFAAAFPQGNILDVFQVIGQGDAVVFGVNSSGATYSNI